MLPKHLPCLSEFKDVLKLLESYISQGQRDVIGRLLGQGGNTHLASMDQSLTSHVDWISYNTSKQPQHHHQQQKMVQKTEHLGLHRSPMMLSTGTPLYSDRMTDNLPDHSLTSTLALSPSASDYTLPGSRKRFASSDGIVYEKTVERRQKRMIKNRESAARSRARKQV